MTFLKPCPKKLFLPAERKKTKKACIDLAKKICRMEGVCKKCGKRKIDGWQIHAAHIIPVTYANTCAMTMNLLPLCAACHSMGPNSMHDNPVHFAAWFNEYYPGIYELLWAIARCKKKVDWTMLYIGLEQEEKLKKYGG